MQDLFATKKLAQTTALAYWNESRKLTRRLASNQEASSIVCPALKRRVTMASHLGSVIDSKYSDYDCTTLRRYATMTNQLGALHPFKIVEPASR